MKKLTIVIPVYNGEKYIKRCLDSVLSNKNIKVIESFRVNNNKFIQILQVGEKYLAISICKDNINVLTELTKEQLTWLPTEDETTATKTPNFQEVLEKLKGKFPRK